MTDPKEKIAQWMRQEYESIIYTLLNMTIGDSPIENLMFCAVYAVGDVRGNQIRRYNYKAGRRETAEEAISRFCYDSNFALAFETQAQIENYRTDFLFAVDAGDGKARKLVVECDGHDFHERTKAQAAHDRGRDRRLQELGYTVYRFTGAELYRDPMKCALQVWAWALG